MSNSIVIEVVAVDVTQPEGKKFKNMEVTYKNQSFQGKTESKKINSYYGKAVFPILEDAKKGDVFTIEREKEGEYWQWTGISAGAAGKSSSTTGPASGSVPATGGRSYVADDVKQDMIIRQSSLASAVNFCKDKDLKHDDVLTIASQFVEFVYNKPVANTKQDTKATSLPADLNDDLDDLPM